MLHDCCATSLCSSHAPALAVGVVLVPVRCGLLHHDAPDPARLAHRARLRPHRPFVAPTEMSCHHGRAAAAEWGSRLLHHSSPALEPAPSPSSPMCCPGSLLSILWTCCGHGRSSARTVQRLEGGPRTPLGGSRVPCRQGILRTDWLDPRSNKLYVKLSRRPVRGKFGVRRHTVS